MFRRFRRRKSVAAPLAPAVEPAPARIAELSGEQIFEQLYARLHRFIGVGGEWALVRRSDADTDAIFQAMATHQIAAELTRAVLVERDLVAEPVGAEPIAMSWEPAPLVVWAEPAAPADRPAAETAIAETAAAPLEASRLAA